MDKELRRNKEATPPPSAPAANMRREKCHLLVLGVGEEHVAHVVPAVS